MVKKLSKPSSSPRGAQPTSKVVAAGGAGALTVVGVWVAGLFGVDVPGYVAAALSTLISTGAAYLQPHRAIKVGK